MKKTDNENDWFYDFNEQMKLGNGCYFLEDDDDYDETDVSYPEDGNDGYWNEMSFRRYGNLVSPKLFYCANSEMSFSIYL